MKQRIGIAFVVISLLVSGLSFAEVSLENNPTLKIMDIEIAVAELDQGDAQDIADKMHETLRKFAFLERIGRPVSKTTEFNVIYTRDTIVAMSDYGFQTRVDMKTLTQNSLEVAVNQMLVGYYSALENLKIVEKQIDNEETKVQIVEEKYKLGLISEFELKEARYQYDLVLSTKISAENSIKSLIRQMNGLLGNSDIDATIEYAWNFEINQLKPLDEYMAMALENRYDVYDLDKQIELKELQVKIYTSQANYYLTEYRINSDYLKTKNELDQLKIDKEIVRDRIENEIIEDYNNALQAYNDYLKTKNTFENQVYNSYLIEKQYNLGYITKTDMIDFSLGLDQLEMGVNASLLNYNNLVNTLDYATGIGYTVNVGGNM
ncbi:MAG: TolC family protein [Clostridiales bacterium]|nr:TolC family protein [Clostridiales bacterium]